MFVNLSDGQGLLVNKRYDELNTLHCGNSRCNRFEMTQAGLKMRFELVSATGAMT